MLYSGTRYFSRRIDAPTREVSLFKTARDIPLTVSREERWEKDSKHLLILEKETDTWKDLDHVDYSEPVFRYAADGDAVAFDRCVILLRAWSRADVLDSAVYREERAPKKKRKRARQGSRKSAGQA